MTEVAARPEPEIVSDLENEQEAVEIRGRRVRRAERRERRAQARLQKARRQAVRRQSQKRGSSMAILRRFLVAIAGLSMLGGAAFGIWFQWLRVPPTKAANVSVETEGGVSSIMVRGGTIEATELGNAAALATEGLVEVDGSVVEVHGSLVVVDGGELVVTDAELRLAGRDGVPSTLLVDGGTLRTRRAVIRSWDRSTTDTDTTDGRAYIDVRNAQVAIEDSTFEGLGYSKDQQPGVLLGDNTTGTVRGLTIRDGYVGLVLTGRSDSLEIEAAEVTASRNAGVEVRGASGLRLSRIAVSQSGDAGLALSGSVEDLVVSDSQFFANATTGIEVNGATSRVELADIRAYRNGQFGVVLSNTRGVTLRDSTIWDNSSGVFLTGANAATTLASNTITGNRGPGIEVASAGTTLAVLGNDIDHNSTGVLIQDGSVDLSDNSIEENGIGVAVLDSSPSVRLTTNQINGNYDVGVRLVDPDGLELEENALLRNEHAAFQVEIESSSEQYWERNEVEAGRYGIERVFSGYGSAADLADITPVPDYFFVEPGQTLGGT